MSGRYSHNAYDHAMRDFKREDRQAVGEVLDAMHDREALGLDASVCARTFLNDAEAVLKRVAGTYAPDSPALYWYGEAMEVLWREFGGGS